MRFENSEGIIMAVTTQGSSIEEREAPVLDDLDQNFGLNSGLRFEPTEELLRELDKGIDDMEAGRVLPHDAVIEMLDEKIRAYEIRHHRDA